MDSFTKEAESEGVTRRVSPQVAERMSYGDRVLLAMKQGKTPVVFGWFKIERLTGFGEEAMDRLWENIPDVKDLGGGGRPVKRGCGSYVTGPSLLMPVDMPKIMSELSDMTAAEIGNLMVGGAFHPHPLARLKDIPFRQGFRLFDYESFIEQALAEQMRLTDNDINRLPALYGQFYADDLDIKPSGTDGGEVQEVYGYRKLEEIQRAARSQLELVK
jgi:hypothetical protein